MTSRCARATAHDESAARRLAESCATGGLPACFAAAFHIWRGRQLPGCCFPPSELDRYGVTQFPGAELSFQQLELSCQKNKMLEVCVADGTPVTGVAAADAK